MSLKTKKISLLAVGIALFVVLSLCLQVPVFENYYLCLGYVVMAVYLYSFGTLSGTVVGFFGVILYCVVISGMRGMPGWALGNVVVGIALGLTFRSTRGLSSTALRALISCVVIVAASALGILAVKSEVEHLLYAQPFLVRCAKNMSAFIADSVMLAFSLPICRILHPYAEKIFPELKKVYHGQVVANISGFSFDEYVECAKIMDREDIVGILELNISCPNVHGGGASFGTDIPTAVEVLKRVKQAVRKPVYVKCTPQCPDLVGMCRALEENGADGLVLSNTFLGIRLDRRTGKPIMKNITGGVSGPGIFPQALYKVYQVYPHVHIPIIGCGGISTADDIIEMMSAGAAAVEIGTLNLTDPQRIPQIITELEQLCDTLHVESITEITGRAHR